MRMILNLAKILMISSFPHYIFADVQQREITAPVVITGKHLSSLSGKDINRLRVLAFSDNKLTVIPFQIDQRTAGGNWIWDVALKGGETSDTDDPPGTAVFDANDQLVFMLRDIGPRVASPYVSLNADTILELDITDRESGLRGWVYIAYFQGAPPSRSASRYTTYLPNELKVISPIYTMAYMPSHLAVMGELTLNGKPILDRTKIRGNVDVKFLFFRGNIEFNEEDVDGYEAGYINGPVRVVKRTINNLRITSNMHAPGVNCDHYFYPYHVEVPVLLTRSLFVHEMDLRVTVDYYGKPFDSAHVESDMRSVRLGVESSADNRLESIRSTGWIALSGVNGSVVTGVSIPDDIAAHVEIRPYLVDGKSLVDPPEGHPGMEPEAGFLMSMLPGFPRGEYVVHMIHTFSSQAYEPSLAVRGRLAEVESSSRLSLRAVELSR